MQYVKLDGVDGNYFNCGPYKSLLSVSACSRNWKAARGTTEDCNRILCRACSIGAMHSGELPVLLTARTLCARCGRSDQRLIRGSICVSCYNRERELIAGKNAKGSFPTHAKRIQSLDYAVQGSASQIHIERVCTPVEAAVMAFRTCSGKAVRMLTASFVIAGTRNRQRKLFVTGVLTRAAPVQMRLF